MAISKGKRFDIFKRDGFTCMYCGQRPPDVVLEVDHVHPRAEGGSDEDLNLVTACYDCNRGKSAKVLGNVSPKPDADLEFLKVQQELAEIRRYLSAKDLRDASTAQLITTLQSVWSEYLTPEWVANDVVIRRWLTKYSASEIEQSIRATSLPYQNGKFGWDDGHAMNGLIRYVSAVLRNRAEENDTGERG